MGNALLLSAQWAKWLLEYGVYFLVIVIALILLAAFKRREKNQSNLEWVQSRIERAKEYADSILEFGNKKGAALLFSNKLLKLESRIADAAWAAYQVVELKKDIVFEGIAGKLDAVATKVMQQSEMGYLSVEEYKQIVENAIEELDSVLKKTVELKEERLSA